MTPQTGPGGGRRLLPVATAARTRGAVRELFESAIQMGRMGLACVEVPDDEIDEVERRYRDNDAERLREQSETGNLRAGIERIIVQNRELAGEG